MITRHRVFRFHPDLEAGPPFRFATTDRIPRAVFVGQGSADGACGFCSLLMALTVAGALSPSSIAHIHDRTYGRLFRLRELVTPQMFSGMDVEDMEAALELFSGLIDFRSFEGRHAATLRFSLGHLEEGRCVLVAIQQSEATHGHWVLATGTEGIQSQNGSYKPSSMLLLDPEEGPPVFVPFDSRLSLQRNKLESRTMRYAPPIRGSQIVILTAAIAVWKRNRPR